MKLSLLLLVVCLQASASGWGQSTITLKVSNQPMAEVLKSVRKQAKMQFILVDPELKGSKPITLSLDNASLKEALDKIFDNQPYTYTITDNVIVVQKRTASFVDPIQANSSDKKIDVKGKVMNEEGEPVAAASIRVKGTKEGTTTNENGEFNIAVDESAVLVVSGVNIETIELRVNGRENVTVFAKMQISPMEEVVSKGYYKEKKLTSVGNVGKVTGVELQRQPVGNPLLGLQGRVAGLEVSQTSGLPGKAPSIRIRGRNSIDNGLNPLYVIDGVPQYNSVSVGFSTLDNPFMARSGGTANNQFFGLNSADIESIEILKDADATAIYGSRGANGVILITTKNGRSKGKETEGTLAFTYGINKIANAYNLLNTKDYLTMRKEAYKNDGIINYPVNAYDINGRWDSTKYTNWQEKLLENSSQYYDIQASLSGHSGNISYSFGLGYHRENSTFPGDFFDQRKSVRLGVNHNSKNERLSFSISILYSTNTNILPLNDLTGSATTLPPNAPSLYDSTGNLNWENGTWTNPLSNLYRIGKSSAQFSNSNIDIVYKILKGLNARIRTGYNTNDIRQANLIKSKAFNPANTNSESSVNIGTVNVYNFSIEPQIDYDVKIKRIKFQALAGLSLSKQDYKSEALSGVGFVSDEQIENISLASRQTILGTRNIEYNYIALFARLNFNLDNSYLINLSGRRDGSSRFGENQKFANFYAVGLGWIFTETKLFKDKLDFISHGKIRSSYGLTGNDQIGYYQYLESYSANTGASRTYYGVIAIRPTRLVNPNYQWEKNEKLEFGLELGFLNDNLFTSVSYFNNKSSNQLLNYILPATTGFPQILNNLPATVINKGIEFELSANVIKNTNFSWRASGNVTIHRNILYRFDKLESSTYATTYTVGQSLSSRKVYDYIGVDPSTGFYSYRDIDGDNKITTLDRTTLLDPSPQYYGGLSNTFKHKRLTLDFILQFVRQKNGDSYYSRYTTPGTMFNQPNDVINRWQKPGDLSSIQKYTATSTEYNRLSLSTGGFEDASFLRLKNISANYELKTKTNKRKIIQYINLFAQAQNVFTITNYTGLDPENKGAYPPIKTIVVGIKAGF